MRGKTVKLKITGMTCPGCAQTVGRFLKREKRMECALGMVRC